VTERLRICEPVPHDLLHVDQGLKLLTVQAVGACVCPTSRRYFDPSSAAVVVDVVVDVVVGSAVVVDVVDVVVVVEVAVVVVVVVGVVVVRRYL
jgi:hypothetical protein